MVFKFYHSNSLTLIIVTNYTPQVDIYGNMSAAHHTIGVCVTSYKHVIRSESLANAYTKKQPTQY